MMATTSCGSTRSWQGNVPSKGATPGSPSRATSRLVVMTMGHGKARGVALALWEVFQDEWAVSQGTTCTATSRGALDKGWRCRQKHLGARDARLKALTWPQYHNLHHNPWFWPRMWEISLSCVGLIRCMASLGGYCPRNHRHHELWSPHEPSKWAWSPTGASQIEGLEVILFQLIIVWGCF